MNKSEHTKIGKFLSFILRHKPDAIGLQLDKQGWAEIEELIAKTNTSDEIGSLNYERLKEVVLSNDKKRFIISDDGTRIRVDLQLKEEIPPETLYHGTAQRFLESIKQEGLKPGERHHVHLSANIETALAVGWYSSSHH